MVGIRGGITGSKVPNRGLICISICTNNLELVELVKFVTVQYGQRRNVINHDDNYNLRGNETPYLSTQYYIADA